MLGIVGIATVSIMVLYVKSYRVRAFVGGHHAERMTVLIKNTRPV